MKNLEKKYFPFTLEKFDEGTGTFSGYASVFGAEDSYGEVVDKGAFKKTLLEKKRHKLFWSHDAGSPGIGYIEPTEDKVGLRFQDAQLYLDIQRAKEAYINLKNGTLDGVSIGYKVVRDYLDPETKLRHLKEIALWEISLCNFQACPGAVVIDVKANKDANETPLTQRCEHCAKALPKEPDAVHSDEEPLPIDEPVADHSLSGYTEAVKEVREFIIATRR